MSHPHGRPETEIRPIAQRINEARPFVMWSVFKAEQLADAEVQVAAVEAAIAETGVTVRGYYDVSGFRADADLMAWFVADTAEAAQAAYRVLRRCALA